MFLYKGYNPDGDQKKEIEFEDEGDAIDHARNECYDFPKYQVIDLDDNEIIDSDKMAKDEEDAIMDSMFPEGQDE